MWPEPILLRHSHRRRRLIKAVRLFCHTCHRSVHPTRNVNDLVHSQIVHRQETPTHTCQRRHRMHRNPLLISHYLLLLLHLRQLLCELSIRHNRLNMQLTQAHKVIITTRRHYVTNVEQTTTILHQLLVWLHKSCRSHRTTSSNNNNTMSKMSSHNLLIDITKCKLHMMLITQLHRTIMLI